MGCPLQVLRIQAKFLRSLYVSFKTSHQIVSAPILPQIWLTGCNGGGSGGGKKKILRRDGGICYAL
jgi:hypothetical protein